ncbi:pao retrotransposon peptidase domain-containing protein [Ditylenchus destructor]|uniref:Pao retrotransposon peptidase domain-containing protein n=1 Tax=Ditylenchus destructor TaxID=166010 RepID=A0AAD4R384_9BILA|nr:pao retrotransposon peptidase domain-containing protein [Ditylenchus destructor]
MSAPFRQLIGPAKSRLQRYTTEVDDLLLDNRPEDEDQHLFLRDARLLKTRLVNVIALLSEQNNRWQQYIAGLPTAEKAAANQEYSDFDTGEDAFTIVLDHGREALDTLQAAIDDETSQTATEQLLQNITATIPNRHTPTNRTASLLSEDLGPLPQNPTYSAPQPNQTNEGLFQSPANYNRGLFQPTNERSGGLFQLPANESDNLFQLPPIKMLRFNGNRADWASFWDMFNVGVHSRMMPRIEKYTRLLSLLYGEAEQLVKGYPYSAEAYPLVIDALKEEYGQTSVLAENLQAELMTMPQAQDNAESLKKTSQAIDRICRQMKLLGHSDEHPLLATTIKAKFPRSVVTKVVDKHILSATPPSVAQLRQDIKLIIASREEVQRTLHAMKPEQPKKDEPRRPELKRATRSTEQARAFSVTEKKNGKPASKTVSTTQQKDGKPPKCFLCDKGLHWARECLVYTTPDDRCKKFAEQSRCFRCCRRGHNANACRKNSTCQNCQGKHHIILCPKLDRKEVRVTNSVTGERDLTRATVNQCLTNLPESEVLLMATDVKVSSPTNPGKQLAAFVFFDNGSQPSFIRTDYAEKLGLRKLTNGELEIHHFNADEPQRFRSPKYGLHIHQEDGTIRKGPRPTTFSPELKSKLPVKLRTVLSSSNKEPDLLIGMRDFWQFVDKVERITPSLTIVHTTVGPMICGEAQGQLSSEEVVTSNVAIVNASPFLLNSTVQHHLDSEATESVDDSARHLAAELKHNMYVDDGTLGAESEEEALFKCSQSKLIFQRAGMNLRGYLVNSDAVMSQIPEEDRSNNDNPKFLGIPWNSQLDELTIKFPTQSTAVVPTRRSVLAELASTFDPLGLVSPAILPAKIFFQALWTKDHSWDSPLNDEESSTWTQLQHNWHDQRITVQRRADASTAHLIFSKNRLKPKDGVTIPRLELLAILIGTRALKFVRQELHRPIKRQVLWSDSQCALRWIASTDDNSKFVTNRLREIRLTDCEFRFVPTAHTLNARMLCARAQDSSTLQLSVMPPPDTSETFEDEPTSSTVMAIAVQEPVPKLFNVERFSSWNTLVRTAMTAMRFLKHRVNIDANSALMQKRKWLSITSEGPFTAEDYKLATLILLQLHQREKSISDHETANLKFFKDEDGLIRLRSRMGNADWTEDSIHPILLWKDTHLVRLLIRQIHEQNHHIGVNATLTEFLAKYWTRHARKNARKALSECMQCRRMLAKPYSLPPMPDHPKQRVRASQIWANIGLDYLGPTLMKKDGRLEKAWIMLVTCLSTRAVHLDVMVSLDTTTFINGFRRFVARRGKPRWVLSDNATGFKAAAACIAAAWQETLSQTQKDPYFTEHEIYWKFIPELAPWFGSTYERLVAIAKDAFRKTVGKNVLTFDELHTFVSEVEASMNHRPLTYVTTDADGILPLRPIDFIQPKALVLLEGPLLDESKDTEYRPVTFSRDRATEAWKATLAYQAKFWERWSEEYLQMLRERSQWTHRAPRLENSTSPKVGEVVLLHDNLRPKNLWKMGRITEVFETPNGIRTAKVLMGKDSILTRPVNKLYSLEVSDYSARVEPPLAPDPPEPAPDPTEPADPTDDTAPRYQLRVNPKKKTLFTAPVLTTLIPLLLLLPYCSGLYAMPPRNPICSECSAQCTNRGLAVSIPAYVDKFEVCCDQTDCESHLYKPLTVIDLPHSQLVNSYSCTIHSWTPDSRSFQPLYLRCPAQDECKLLNCYLCWEAIGNPSCLPGMAIWAIALLLTSFGCCVAGLFRHCCLNIDFCCGWLFRGTWHLLHGLLIGLSRRLRHLSPADKAKLRSSHTRDRRSYRSLARGRVTLCIVTLCLLCTEPVLGTTYTHSLSTREEACIQNGKEKTCYVNAVTQLSLLPAGQTTTMVLTDQNMRAIGSIALVVETVRMTCTPKNVLITRSYKVRTEAVKRCPRQGSCVDDYCSKVNLKTQIEELKEWNHLPGNTYCTDSCSFWWCRCGLPTPACLFYRVFAEPASASVYEVFKCSSWEYQVLVSLTLKTDTNSTSTLISLTPGMTSRWGNISLTPTSVSQAPVPVLGSYFLTDGTRTAMLDKVHTDLHCSDVATAANFSCQLSPTACAGCQVAEDTISCQCRDLRLEDFMEDPSIRLPLRVSGYQIRENNSKVFAETHRAAIQLTVKIDKVKLTTVYDGSTCRLTPQQLTGCYSCDSGGELKFKCTTDHGRALANIKCEQGQWFTALCSQNEEEQTTLLSFTKAVINESCKVECPGGSSSFLLSGTLSYVPHRLSQPFNSIQGKDDPEAPSGGTCFLGFCIELDIWSYLMLLINWQNCLWLILCVFVALIALWIYLKLNPAFRIWKMVARTYLTGLLLTSTLATPFANQQNLATSLGIRPNQMTQKWGYISSELYLHPITRPMALNESPLIDFEISRYESPSHDTTTLKSTFSCSGSNRSNSKSDVELSEPSKKLKLAEPAKAVLRSLLHRRPPLKFSAGVSRTATLTKQKNFQQNII